MKGFLAGCLIMRAAQRLAIDRDYPLHRFAEALHPVQKTGFKLFRINVGKNPAKGVMGGDPVGQAEQVREPGLLRLPKFFDFYPSFCSADDSTDRNDDDIA
jgi:hypothetical protein